MYYISVINNLYLVIADDADGYQYTKPTQGYLPAASSVDEATKKPFKADAYIPPVDDERHFSGN